MKKFFFLVLAFCTILNCQNSEVQKPKIVNDLDKLLSVLDEKTDNKYLRLHAESICRVLNTQKVFLSNELTVLEQMYKVFSEPGIAGNGNDINTYLNRKRPLIISWKSKIDGKISLGYLRLPAKWNPNMKYPLYVDLHGNWDVASDPITYMAFSFQPENVASDILFENGYYFSSWGRGNQWYEGIAEKDVLEGIEYVSGIFGVDDSQKYITGMSMGGYGAWHLAVKYPDMWKGVGIYAGALTENNMETVLNAENAAKLKKIPVFIICGKEDPFRACNVELYNLLKKTGNKNIAFREFDGGHEYKVENMVNMYKWFNR